MTWTYSQSTGDIRHNGVSIGTGYSGAGTIAASGRNNASMQDIPFQGPIPAGQYRIGAAYHHPEKGTNSMNLTPVGHGARGRNDFMIHGNDVQNNASQGCIILGPAIRQRIASSNDPILVVQP